MDRVTGVAFLRDVSNNMWLTSDFCLSSMINGLLKHVKTEQRLSAE